MSRARRVLAVRVGEGPLVALLAGLFATVEMGRGLGEVAADTLFISRFGSEFLPYLYVGLGLVSLVVALGYGAAIGRLRRGPFLVALLATFAVILVVMRLAIATGAPAVLPAAWLTVNVFAAILMTLVWTVAGTSLDARQAKRIFPICTSAAIAGGFGGTLLAGPLARLVGIENLLVLFAGLLAVAAALTSRIGGRFSRPVPSRTAPAALRTELAAGFEYVRRSPLLRLVAVAYVLFAVLLFSVTFPFLRAAAEAFPNEADLATALGLLSAAVTAASFVVSIALANRVYTRFGVATAAVLLPVVYLAGFALWLVSFSLVTAVIFRFTQQVTQRGLSNAAWSAMYGVVPAERRPQVLAFIDGVPGQLGTSLSGVLLIVVGALFAPTQIFILGLVTAAGATWVVLLIRRRYGEALVRTLRAGLAEQVLEGGPGLVALAGVPQVREQLVAGLDAESAAARRLAVEVLGRIGGPGTRQLALRALDDRAAEVRIAALGALARSAAPDGEADTIPIVAALTDPDGGVRAAAVRVLASTNPALLDPHIDALGGDPSPDARAATAVALASLGRRADALTIVDGLLRGEAIEERVAGLRAAPGVGTGLDRILAGLGDGAAAVRRTAAHALAAMPDAAPALANVLESGSDEAQEAALIALSGRSDAGAHDGVREWALRRVERAFQLRRAATALTGMDGPSADGSLDFLRSVVARRERTLETRLLAAIAALGAAEANGLIRRCLRAPDPDVRAQAIEALDALGDRKLARAVVRLLDADTVATPSDPAVTLRALAEDPDPWIRGLAMRALALRLAGERQAIFERASSDPDPVVRSAVARRHETGGSTMPETAGTLGEVERMLFLRAVPLFVELDPEDLQRIAVAARERLYSGGETLVAEGEVGDELIVIVEGTVRVMRSDGDEQRFVRTYEAGDHVGELAVLRERPRAATVIAADDGVRGLVINGEALRAILRERPEAAMAMLATLAERISRQ